MDYKVLLWNGRTGFRTSCSNSLTLRMRRRQMEEQARNSSEVDVDPLVSEASCSLLLVFVVFCVGYCIVCSRHISCAWS